MCNAEQKGRSFIEMMGVMLIIGLITIAAYQGHNKAVMKNKINKTFEQVSLLTTRIRATFAKQGDYENLNTQMAINLGLVDDEMKNENSGIKGMFGPIEIDSQEGRYDEDKDSAFYIKLANVPKEVCHLIVARYWSVTLAEGFLGVGVNEDTTDCLSDWSSNSDKVICTYGATDKAVLSGNVAVVTGNCVQANEIYLKFQ